MPNPENFTIVYNNPIDDARVLTASSEVPTMPVSRLRTQQRTDIFRTLGCAAEWIEFEFNQAARPDFFGLINHNCASGSVRLRLHTYHYFPASVGATLVDETFTFGPNFIYTIAQQPFGRYGVGGSAGEALASLNTRTVAPPLCRFFTAPDDYVVFGRLDFSDPYNADGFIKAARLYCAKSLTFSRNIGWNSGVECVDPSVMIRTPEGLSWFDVRAQYFQRGVNIGKISSRERYYQLMDFWLTVGTTGYFIVILEPESLETSRFTSHYVRLSQNPKIDDAFVDQHDVVLQFEEVR